MRPVVSACAPLMRGAFILLLALASANTPFARSAWAQGSKGADVPPAPDAPPVDTPPPIDTPKPPPGDAVGSTKVGQASETVDQEKRWEEAKKTWQDIVVLPRKSFLKRGRIELTPFIGTTINDPLIQHTALGGELNFFLSDIFAVGVRGIYFLSNVMNDEFWVRYHFERVPTLNRYIAAVSGDFSYVPIYGKFTVFNQQIFQYEFYVSGGVGVTHTEVIPRTFDNEPFTNWSLTFPVGIGARFFFTRWLAAQAAFRDYMMLDTFEATGRTLVSGDEAKKREKETRFIHNMIFTVGISVFFPLDFKYTTFR